MIRTDLIKRIMSEEPDYEAARIARHPIGKLGMPEEVAEAAAWLLSDESSFVTGTALSVDGGYTAR